MTLAAAALLALALAAPANAGLLVSSATNCHAQDLSRPFTRWLDPFSYTIVPGGTFENGASGWTLSGGAYAGAGNESFNVHGAGETRSLSLPARSSAVSPAICVGIGHPTMRLFAKSSRSLLSLSTLRVDVLFEDAGGKTRSLPIGLVTASTSWQPSLPLPVLASLLPLLPGERTAVAFRFTPQGGASWQIDDVYVDPFRRS